MSKTLDRRTAAPVRATVPALEAHGLAVARRTHERMFQDEDAR